MKLTSNQLLKTFCLVSSLIAIFLWVVLFIQLFNNNTGLQKPDYLLQNPNIATYPLFCIFSIIILVKANSNKGVLMFSLFLSLLSQNIAIPYLFVQNPDYNNELILAVSFILTSIAFIKSFQNFPQQISASDIHNEFSKNKLVRIYLTAALKKQVWFIFPIVILVLTILFPRNSSMHSVVLLIVLFTALLFLYVNFKISTPSSRNKITWLLWGILCFTFLVILNSIILYSGSAVHQNIAIFFKILRALSLFVSVTMCLFFFDTFDTGVLIRRTVVDGIIFIAIVFLYNTIEHYFLHWMSHKLHISNTLISSILSGFFVLVFSPVHHKFMHVLDDRFKRKETHYQEIGIKDL